MDGLPHLLYSLLLRSDSIVVLRSQLLQLLRRRLHTHRIHSAQPSSLASQFLALAHHIDPLAFLRAAPQRPQRIALRSYSASHNHQSRQHRFRALAGGMTATFLSKLLGSSCAFGVYLPNSWRVGFSCSHPSSSVRSPAVGARAASSASSRARMSSFRPVS